MKMGSQDKKMKFTVAIFSILAFSLWGNTTALAEDSDQGFCDCSIAEDSDSQLICHIPPGNNSNMHTIRVGDPAIHAHLDHGDMLGPCPGDDEEEHHANEHITASYPTCTCEDGSTGIWFHAPLDDSGQSERQRSINGQ